MCPSNRGNPIEAATSHDRLTGGLLMSSVRDVSSVTALLLPHRPEELAGVASAKRFRSGLEAPHAVE
jgi:hypothetical protein